MTYFRSSNCDGGELYNYLVGIGFSVERVYATTHKLRALKCLLAVVDDNDMEDCTMR